MKYLVLRNCYTVEDRYFRGGDVVELPDEMFKYEKNFRLADEPLEKPEEITEGKYRCSKCKTLHRETDKKGSIGKRHLKYKE